MAKQG